MSEPAFQSQSVTSPDFTDGLDFTVDIPLESWRLRVPAKGACYALEDAEGRCVLLATTADLRQALLSRLSPSSQADLPSGKIDYRSIVRRVRWREVYSRWEGNWVYLENVRRLLPGGYQKLIDHWQSHWVAVDPAARFPWFLAADHPIGPTATCFGPLRDAAAARRAVEALEDFFDLCRYHHILTQAPHGQACAYKQMGRCPAPCDGTITLEEYRRQIHRAIVFITQPRENGIAEVSHRMKAAAAEHRFEDAARFKKQLDLATVFEGAGASRPLDAMRFLTIQRGLRKGSFRVFAITPGVIEYLGEVEGKQWEGFLPKLAAVATELLTRPMPEIRTPEIERIALAGWHWLGGNREQGLFLTAEQATAPENIREAVERWIRIEDVTGCLKYKGPPKTVEQMNEAVLTEARRQAGCD